MSSVPSIILNNGVEIPQLGFGVFQIPPDRTRDATLAAFEVGYRHIDTAQMYGNERAVGEAFRRSGLRRDEVFITSKLNNSFHAHAAALAAFDRSLDRLELDQLDLFLIHWPLPTVSDYVETWQAMEEMAASGRVRAIGVSNFQVAHLQRLFDRTETVPAVNQIELHPYLTQQAVRRFDAEHGIATEAWSPIAQGLVLDDPVLVDIARTAGKTTAQVVLRWHVQRGDIVFPKTVTPARLRENFDIFDFELAPADIDRITGLNRDHRTGPDPDVLDFVPDTGE